MELLITAGIFPPDIGGPANFVPRLAAWLSKRGHRVRVLCWSDTLAHDDSHYPFEVHRVLRGRFPLLRFAETVVRLCQLGRSADVLFANTLDLESRIAAMLLGKPAVHKVVGDRAWEVSQRRGWFAGTIDEYQQAKHGWRLAGLRLWALNQLRNFSLGRSHFIITPSQYLANIVGAWHGDRKPISVIYNSTQLNPLTEPIDLPAAADRTITTVCRLVPWKGVERLIQAVAKLDNNVRLVIAGEGPERSHLEQLSTRLGLSDRVLFLGQISKSQVGAVLQASDIFVLNSTYEGLPHVVLEAMAAKVPVIATDVGGTSEVVRSDYTGILIPSKDNDALISSLNRLLHSPEQGRQLADNGRKLIEQTFAEEQCFMRYEKALTAMARR